MIFFFQQPFVRSTKKVIEMSSFTIVLQLQNILEQKNYVMF